MLDVARPQGRAVTHQGWKPVGNHFEREVRGYAYDEDTGLFAKGLWRCHAREPVAGESLAYWHLTFERTVAGTCHVQLVDCGQPVDIEIATARCDDALGYQFRKVKRARKAEQAKDAPLKAIYEKNRKEAAP